MLAGLSRVCAGYVWTFFRAENVCLTDVLVDGIVNNKADNFILLLMQYLDLK
jgi:hypothetical protein